MYVCLYIQRDRPSQHLLYEASRSMTTAEGPRPSRDKWTAVANPKGPPPTMAILRPTNRFMAHFEDSYDNGWYVCCSRRSDAFWFAFDPDNSNACHGSFFGLRPLLMRVRAECEPGGRRKMRDQNSNDRAGQTPTLPPGPFLLYCVIRRC